MNKLCIWSKKYFYTKDKIKFDKVNEFVIPNEYTIIFNKIPSLNFQKNNFELNNRQKCNSLDKIKNPYLNVLLKPNKLKKKKTKKNEIDCFNKNIKSIKLFKDEEKKNNENFYSDSISTINTNFNDKSNIKIKEFDSRLFGLNNIGHSCYINSFLQILFRTPFFMKNLKLLNNKNGNKDIFINSLIQLSENPDKEIIIIKLKKIMANEDKNYGNFSQKDSQEFGINLINKLINTFKGDYSFFDDEDEKLLNEKITIFDIEKYKNECFQKYIQKYFKNENEIFLEKMFQFHESKLIIEVEENKKEFEKIDRINFETSINIELTFPYYIKKKEFTINELLENRYPEYHNFFNELNNESIDKNDEAKWEQFKKKIITLFQKFIEMCFNNQKYNNSAEIHDNKKKNDNHSICFRRLASLPEILVISINRAFLGKSLNNSYLQFNKTLDLKDYIDDDILDKKNTTYKLYAVNECKGFFKNYGHCYSYVNVKNKWYKFDDNNYKEESPNFNSKYVVGLYYIRDNINF